MSLYARVSSLYWRFFSFVVRRIIAVGFFVAGCWGALSNLPMLLPGGAVVIDGVREDDLGMRALMVGFPLLFAVLGVALFRAKPFVPGEAGERKH
jgi:hypothetical protein